MSKWHPGLKGFSTVTAFGLSVVGLASAQALGQARSVKVTQNGTDTLELAEVRAFQSGRGD
jgi:hypothetical protein